MSLNKITHNHDFDKNLSYIEKISNKTSKEVDLLVNNNSYSSLTLYKIEKDYFLAEVIFNYKNNGNLEDNLDKYNKNISSFDKYKDKCNNINNINLSNISSDKYLDDIMNFLENKVDLLENNEFIIKLLGKTNKTDLENKLILKMKGNIFFNSFINYKNNDILKYFKDNKYIYYEYGNKFDIIYKKNNFYFIVDINNIECYLYQLLIKLSNESEEAIEEGNYYKVKINNVNLLKCLINSKEKLNEEGEKYKYITDPIKYSKEKYNNYRIDEYSFDLNKNNDYYFPLEKEIQNNINIYSKDNGISELNYFNYEIDKFLKGEFLSEGKFNFNKLNATKRLDVNLHNMNYIFHSNLSTKDSFDINDYSERFVYYLEKKIFENKNKEFIKKLKNKNNKNNVENIILEKIKKKKSLLYKINKFLNKKNNFELQKFSSEYIKKHISNKQKSIEYDDLSYMYIDVLEKEIKKSNINSDELIQLALLNKFNFLNYNKISNKSLENIDLNYIFEDINSIYNYMYDNEEFLKYINEGLKELILGKDFKNIHIFETFDVPFLTLYEKKIDNNTIYLGGLNSIKNIGLGLIFFEKLLNQIGINKDILLEVALTVGEEKNKNAEFLIGKYESLGFEIIGEKGEKRNKDYSLAYKYIKMKRKGTALKNV